MKLFATVYLICGHCRMVIYAMVNSWNFCNYLNLLKKYSFLLVDVTVYHRGFHGDLNETLFIGEVDEKSKQLTKVTYEALMAAINIGIFCFIYKIQIKILQKIYFKIFYIVKPGVKFREIGNVIQKHVSSYGYSVVRNYCGHGIHRLFHTAPNVPHYSSKTLFF